MPPRLPIRLRLGQSLRPRPTRPTLSPRAACLPTIRCRGFADKADKTSPPSDPPAQGPNQDVLPHVSEEAATTGQITGEGGPDLDQGTPVQEVRDTSLAILISFPIFVLDLDDIDHYLAASLVH